MKQITVHSKNTNAFNCDRGVAFRLLFTMIMSDKETCFWFGSTAEGGVSLYINSAEFCKTIAEHEYQSPPTNTWNVDGYFFEPENGVGQKELLCEYYKNPLHAYEDFMREYGVEAREFWG